ncbi:MAG: transcriptional regulator [Gallionellaceae bacterium]|nr:MAG: transcriptional regulator [Gallionellaceae bacterium]
MPQADIRKLSAKMRHGEIFTVECPSCAILKHVTSRWGVLVALLEGTHRFSDLRRKVGGVSEKMLAQTLQYLEKDGSINRVSHPVVVPHVGYSPTPLGVGVGKQLEALTDRIETNLPKIMKVQQKR